MDSSDLESDLSSVANSVSSNGVVSTDIAAAETAGLSALESAVGVTPPTPTPKVTTTAGASTGVIGSIQNMLTKIATSIGIQQHGALVVGGVIAATGIYFLVLKKRG